MLVSDIVRRVRDSAGDINVLQFSQTTLTDWINDAVRECVIDQSLLQARASSNTVIGQVEYTLPVDIFKLHSVTYNGRKLKVMTLEEWEVEYSEDDVASSGNGDPRACYVYAGILNIWPAPDLVKPLVINYTKLPATITYTAGPPESWNPTEPPINAAYHNRLVSYCLAQVALQDEDHYKYNMLMTEFKTGVREVDTKHEEDLYPFISVSANDMGDGYYG